MPTVRKIYSADEKQFLKVRISFLSLIESLYAD